MDIKEGDVLFYTGSIFAILDKFSIGDKCVVYNIGPMYQGGRRKISIINTNGYIAEINISLIRYYFEDITVHRNRIINDLI